MHDEEKQRKALWHHANNVATIGWGSVLALVVAILRASPEVSAEVLEFWLDAFPGQVQRFTETDADEHPYLVVKLTQRILMLYRRKEWYA